jgi:serine/threonine protein phosphatase PrpC
MSGLEHFVDVSCHSLPKHNEEVCGDSVTIKKRADGSTVVVLSDGLGSGIKASILSTLTTRIIATMLERGVALKDVVETLVATLPICAVRKSAYSTFTILRISPQGEVTAIEYGNPPPLFIHRRKLAPIPRSERRIDEIRISESHFSLDSDDYLVLVSDGVIHAGLEKAWSLGWQWERVGKFLEESAQSLPSAASLTERLLEKVDGFYEGVPGDDAIVVVIHLRLFRCLMALVGPPLNPEDDEKVVKKLVDFRGLKVVCGGSTASIVARVLEEELMVDLSSVGTGIPPIASLKGIDLVTEGILTLSGALERIKKKVAGDELKSRGDGASRLANLLLSADSIKFVVGQAINPSHQNPQMPAVLAMKRNVVESLSLLLKEREKEVTVEYC